MFNWVAYVEIEGQCCDYGWGHPGNVRIYEFEADTKDEAVRLSHEEFGDLLQSDSPHRVKRFEIWRIGKKIISDQGTEWRSDGHL